MTKVRLGLIGLGNIGQHHASYLSAGKVTGAELVAVLRELREHPPSLIPKPRTCGLTILTSLHHKLEGTAV